MLNILNTDLFNYDADQRAQLEACGTVTDGSDYTQADLLANVADYDVIIIGLTVRIDAEVLERAKNLKLIASATTGLTHIDLPLLDGKGIKLVSLKPYTSEMAHITGTAELALTLLLACLRSLPSAVESSRRGEWAGMSFYGNELHGKTVGIIGMGRLGSWMARYCEAFGCTVLFTDPAVETAPAGSSAQRVDLATLLAESEVISLHASYSDENAKMLGAAEFAAMKKQPVFINTARGELVDDDAMLDALRTGTVRVAGLDVIAGEEHFDNPEALANNSVMRFQQEHPDKLIITPHLGGRTAEATFKARALLLSKLLPLLME